MPDVPVAIYAAKSSPDEKGSLVSQVDAARAAIEREGGRTLFADPFTEENVSGYRGNRGPALETAITAVTAAADQGAEAELWVFHSSRLGRGSGRKDEARSLQEIFTQLRRRGVAIRSVEDDPFVTNPMLIGVAGEMAHKYSEDLAAHVRRGKDDQFERGLRLGGPVPFGLQLVVASDTAGRATSRHYKRVEPQAGIAELAFELSERGLGDGEVARALNRAGHATQSGGAWSRRRIQDLVTNPIYAGRVVRHRGKANEETASASNVDPLIDPERFDRIVATRTVRDLAQPEKHRRGGRPTARHALARLAVCHRCGEHMYAQTLPHVRKDGTRRRRYVCKNVHTGTGLCEAPSVDAERVDTAVASELDRLFIDVKAWQAELGRGLLDKRTAIESRRDATESEGAKLARREGALQERWLDAMDAGDDRREEIVYEALETLAAERDAVRKSLRALERELVSLPTEPPIDAVLDLYNDLSRSLRGAEGRTMADLNVRLRAVFAEFRIETLEDEGVLGVLPVLRPDVVERFGSDEMAVVIGGEPVGIEKAAATHPVALFATGEEALPTSVGLNVADEYWKWREAASSKTDGTLRRSGG